MRCYEYNIVPFNSKAGSRMYCSPVKYNILDGFNIIPLRRKGCHNMRLIHNFEIIPDIQKNTNEPLTEEER